MDVLYFLKKRTAYIRQFYEQSFSTFEEVIRLIEAGEDPFIQEFAGSPIKHAYRERYRQARRGYLAVRVLTKRLAANPRGVGRNCAMGNLIPF